MTLKMEYYRLTVLGDALDDIHRRYKDGHRQMSGICAEVAEYMRFNAPAVFYEECDHRAWMAEKFKKMDGFSGVVQYPIRGADGQLPNDAYIEAWASGSVWSGEYGSRRVEALEYLMREAREERLALINQAFVAHRQLEIIKKIGRGLASAAIMSALIFLLAFVGHFIFDNL